MSDPRLLVVVPAYNESARLDRDTFEKFVLTHPGVALHFVDDGSTDATSSLLQAMAAAHPGRITQERLPANRGKAEAVRQGLRTAAAAGFGVAGYIDADLAAPLEVMVELADALTSAPDLRLVIGSRVKLLGWPIERSPMRHYAGRLFATCAAVVLDLPIYDTQCGAKVLRLEPKVVALLDPPFLSRWLFDVELIARVRDACGAAAMREHPLPTWIDHGGSTLGPLDVFRAPFELMRIRSRYPPRRESHASPGA